MNIYPLGPVNGALDIQNPAEANLGMGIINQTLTGGHGPLQAVTAAGHAIQAARMLQVGTMVLAAIQAVTELGRDVQAGDIPEGDGWAAGFRVSHDPNGWTAVRDGLIRVRSGPGYYSVDAELVFRSNPSLTAKDFPDLITATADALGRGMTLNQGPLNGPWDFDLVQTPAAQEVA